MKKPAARYCWRVLLPALVIAFVSCNKDNGNDIITDPSASIVVRFHHTVDTVPLALNELVYHNNAGNLYEVTDLQYFISDFTFHLAGGGAKVMASNDGIHYIDLGIPDTKQWFPSDKIPTGAYDEITFTFGLGAANNISNRFPDAPERDMFWPDLLGGGYHHMKMNIAWQDTAGLNPFNMHLGTGQIYSTPDPNVDSITGFVQNSFTVTLPASSFQASAGTNYIDITMDINRWLNGPPNTFDLRSLPPGIMQNQELMHKVCENGAGVFTVKISK